MAQRRSLAKKITSQFEYISLILIPARTRHQQRRTQMMGHRLSLGNAPRGHLEHVVNGTRFPFSAYVGPWRLTDPPVDTQRVDSAVERCDPEAALESTAKTRLGLRLMMGGKRDPIHPGALFRRLRIHFKNYSQFYNRFH